MKPRVDFRKVLMPRAMRALQPTSNYVNSSGLDHRLLDYRPGMFEQPKAAQAAV